MIVVRSAIVCIIDREPDLTGWITQPTFNGCSSWPGIYFMAQWQVGDAAKRLDLLFWNQWGTNLLKHTNNHSV